MLDLRAFIGDKYKVTLEDSYGIGGDRPKHHYYILKGRRGDIMAWDDDTLEVTVYGRTITNRKPLQATHNLSLPIKLERQGWLAISHFDDCTCFLLKKERIYEAIKVIKAKKLQLVTEASRQRGRELAARFGFSKPKPKQEEASSK